MGESWGDRVVWLDDLDDDFRSHLVVWSEAEDVCPEVTLCGRELSDCDYHHDPVLGLICVECVRRLLGKAGETPNAQSPTPQGEQSL